MAKRNPEPEGISNNEILYHLLINEHGYYKTILVLTQLENDHLLSNQPLSKIQPLHQHKKAMLNCIREVENILTPYKKIWSNTLSKKDPFFSIINEALADINNLLKEILQLDLKNQKLLKDQLTDLKNKLGTDKKQTVSVS